MWGAALMGGHATTVSGTMVIGVNAVGPSARGFYVFPNVGSLSPSTLDGRDITGLYDETSTTPFTAVLRMAGFASDPGIDYLVSIKVGSVTRLGSSASGGYLGGVDGIMEWFWSLQPFGIATSGSTNFTLITK